MKNNFCMYKIIAVFVLSILLQSSYADCVKGKKCVSFYAGGKYKYLT